VDLIIMIAGNEIKGHTLRYLSYLMTKSSLNCLTCIARDIAWCSGLAQAVSTDEQNCF